MTREEIKKYAISAALTFFTGVALVVVPALDNITIESFKDGALVGLLFAGTRTGIKMLLEAYLAWRAGK